MKRIKEIFSSEDCEADGPIPGVNSMLSLGSAVFDMDKNLLGTFCQNFLELDGAVQDERTMQEFWLANPKNEAAYNATRVDMVHPKIGMQRFHDFLNSFGERPVMMGFPASFDFGMRHWYFHKFLGDDPSGFSCLDIKSYAASVLKIPFRYSAKRNYPKRWVEKLPHNHHCLVDAIGQGVLGINILRENMGLTFIPVSKDIVNLTQKLVDETNAFVNNATIEVK